MLSGVANKALVSSIFDAAIGGGSFGIVKLTGNNNTNFEKQQVSSEILKKEEKIIHKSSDKKEVLVSPIQSSQKAKVEISSSPTTSLTDKELSKDSISKTTEKVDIKLENYQENIKQEKFQEETVVDSEITQTKESEEDLKKKFDSEIDERKISLEAIWGRKHSWNTVPENTCFLLTKDQEGKKNLPDMGAEDEEEEENDEACYGSNTTSWTDNKRLGDNSEAFWVRGKNKWVKEMIIVNWDNLLTDSHFALNSKDKPTSSSFEIREKLSKSCLIEDKRDKDWVEITCITK